MQRLQRINPSRHAAKEALPDVLGLAKYGINFYRSQVTLIAAWPSMGKSVLALGGLALPWAQAGYKSLYFSADSDEFTTLKRAAANVTGQPQDYIQSQMQAGWSEIQGALADLHGGVSFSFETDPTYQHLYEETIAFWHLWGEYPAVIFIDNLMDVAAENENEYGGMRDTNKAVKRLARLTGAQVIILHHCNEEDRPGLDLTLPPPRSKVTGKVSQTPSLLLTLGLDEDAGIMRVAPVKNREGKQDRTGRYNIPLRVDFQRMRFSKMDHTPLGWV